MKNTLITIDSFLSNQERADVCQNLIKQIRKVFGDEYSILLINKSNTDFGIQKQVDYYFNLSNSFLVGYPKAWMLDTEIYERPYVYVDTDIGTCENWLPLTGITDHVGGIFNSFILSSEISKMLGFTHIFKIEYDTVFDLEELYDIKKDVESEKDYIFYGTRKMGEYAKEHHYLIDVHIIGYKNNLFDGFTILKNDSDFWLLCEKINYFGKWIEYIIPSAFEFRKRLENFDGLEYAGHLENKYPKSSFDIINGVGGWTEKWKSIPKVCPIKNSTKHMDSEFILFYWNEDFDQMEIQTTVEDEFGKIVYEKNINLGKNHFSFDVLNLTGEFFYIKKRNISDNKIEEFTEKITKNVLETSNTQFKLKN